MKKLLVFAAALGLFACVPASAQNNDHRGDKHNNGGSNAAHASKPADTNRGMSDMKGRDRKTMQNSTSDGRAATTGRSPGTRQNTPAVATQNRFLPNSGDTKRAPPPAADTNRNTGWSGNANTNRATTDRNRNNWSGNANSNRATTDRNRNNWSGNTATRQRNNNSLRLNVQASRRFHGGNYQRPSGYQYRHWGYGERLPRTYYVRNYWIADFLMFGLFAPPADLVWVRVGDDALLIDRDTGEIVQVRYGVFY